MFKLSSFILAAVLAAPALVRADDLGKEFLFPDGLHDPLIKFDTIQTSPIKEQRVSSIPSQCTEFIDDSVQCDKDGMEAREVFYEDCEQSWTLCRCGDANMNLDQMQERFGQVPPGIRSYVGVAVATKADGCSAVAINGAYLRFHGDCPMTVFLHEAGHTLDQGMSGSEEFKSALAADTCVPDGYANVALPEDWTQLNVLLTYTKQFEPLPKDNACLKNQFDLLANDQRIIEAQDTKTCLPDRRPFLTTNDNAPPAEPSPEPVPEPEPSPPAEDPSPEPPTDPNGAPGPVDPVPEPEPTTPPSGCKSAKFRRFSKAKRAAKRAYRAVKRTVKSVQMSIPYSA